MSHMARDHEKGVNGREDVMHSSFPTTQNGSYIPVNRVNQLDHRLTDYKERRPAKKLYGKCVPQIPSPSVLVKAQASQISAWR